MRPKKRVIIIEDDSDDDSDTSSGSNESDVSISTLRERLREQKIHERLMESDDSNSSNDEAEDIKRRFSELQTAMSVGLQGLIAKHRDRTRKPLSSITTEKETDVQIKQELTSLSCIKKEKETDPQTLSSIQIKQEPQDVGETREREQELTFHPGNVKTEPQDIEKCFADQGTLPVNVADGAKVSEDVVSSLHSTAKLAARKAQTVSQTGEKTKANIQPPVRKKTGEQHQARGYVYRYLLNAVRSGYRVPLEEGLAILKEEGVDICLASLLHVAVKYDQVSVAECLLESGADANAKDKNGCDVLIKGCSNCSYCSYEMVKLLLRHGAAIQTDGSTTALHEAAGKGNVAICELLIKHGADPKTKNSSGLTPLDIVLKGPHSNRKVLVCLLKTSVPASTNSIPIEAVQQQPKSSTDTVINSEPIETEPALVRADSMKDRVCEEKKENAADGVDVIQKAYQTNAANKDSDSKCIDQVQMETVEKLPKTAYTTSKKVFQCRACKLVFFDTKCANIHILGKKHQQKVKPGQTNTAKTRLYGRENRQCDLCQVEYNTMSERQQHLKGKRHAQMVKWLADGCLTDISLVDQALQTNNSSKGLESKSTDMSGPAHNKRLVIINCQPCKRVFFDKMCAEVHSNSKKHKRNMNCQQNINRTNSRDSYSTDRRCELCQVEHNTLSQRQQHLKGKKHKRMVKLLADGRFVDITKIDQTTQTSKGIILQTPNEPSAPIGENKTSISTTVTLPPAQCLMDTQTSNEKETHNGNKKTGVRTEIRNIGWITCGKRKSEDLEAHDLGSSRNMKKCCIVSPMKYCAPAKEENISSAGNKEQTGSLGILTNPEILKDTIVEKQKGPVFPSFSNEVKTGTEQSFDSHSEEMDTEGNRMKPASCLPEKQALSGGISVLVKNSKKQNNRGELICPCGSKMKCKIWKKSKKVFNPLNLVVQGIKVGTSLIDVKKRFPMATDIKMRLEQISNIPFAIINYEDRSTCVNEYRQAQKQFKLWSVKFEQMSQEELQKGTGMSLHDVKLIQRHTMPRKRKKKRKLKIPKTLKN